MISDVSAGERPVALRKYFVYDRIGGDHRRLEQHCGNAVFLVKLSTCINAALVQLARKGCRLFDGVEIKRSLVTEPL